MRIVRIAAVLAAAMVVFPLLADPAKLVMVTEVWAPYRMNDATSPSGFAGIDIDLMSALEAKLGVPIVIQRVPWARALEMMREGQADLITGIARTSEREVFMRFIPTSYSAVRPRFYAPKGKGATVRSYADLKGKSIGMSTNSSYFPEFDADASLGKMGLSTEEQILKVLALGRIDLAIGTDPNLSWDIARLGYKDKVERTSWQPEATTPLYLAVSRKTQASDLAGRIDAILAGLLSDGTMDRILAKYR